MLPEDLEFPTDTVSPELMVHLITRKEFKLYMLFVLGYGSSFILMPITALVFLVNYFFGGTTASELSVYIKKITSFSFSFSELDHAVGSKEYAIEAAIGLIGTVVLAILLFAFRQILMRLSMFSACCMAIFISPCIRSNFFFIPAYT